jgi:hypothetical protein
LTTALVEYVVDVTKDALEALDLDLNERGQKRKGQVTGYRLHTKIDGLL